MIEAQQQKLVIVADDEPPPRRFLEDSLLELGYAVQSVDHPSKIERIGDCLALIMDIRFPPDRFLGLDYVIQKRESGELPAKTLVIFITNFTKEAPSPKRLQRAGYHVVLYKPLEITAIRKRLAAAEAQS